MSLLKKQIIWNTLSGWFSVLTKAGLALLIVPFLITNLGKDGYGIIGLLGTVMGFSSIADLGLRGALSRELTEKKYSGDSLGYNELMYSAFWLYVLIGIVLSVFLWNISPIIIDVFKIPLDLKFKTLWVLRIYGTFTLLCSFITPVFSSGLISINRFDINNSINIFSGIFSSISLFIVLPIVSEPIYAWAGVMLATSLFTTVLSIFAFIKSIKCNFLQNSSLKLKVLFPLFKLSGNLYVIQLAQALSDQADPLILSYFKGPNSLALYQPASKLSQMFNPIVMTLTNQLTTISAELHLDGNKRRLEDIFINGTKYTLIPGLFVSLGVVVFSEPFAKLWLFQTLNSEYLTVASIMQLFAIIDLFTYSSGTQWPILLGMKRLNYLTFVLILTAILNVIVSIYFVGYTNQGILGVLYGTLISKIIRVIILNNYIIKLLEINFTHYMRKVLLRIILCLILYYLSGLSLIGLFDIQNWFDFAIAVSSCLLVWSIICWFVALDNDDRKKIKFKLNKSLFYSIFK